MDRGDNRDCLKAERLGVFSLAELGQQKGGDGRALFPFASSHVKLQVGVGVVYRAGELQCSEHLTCGLAGVADDDDLAVGRNLFQNLVKVSPFAVVGAFDVSCFKVGGPADVDKEKRIGVVGKHLL